MQKLTFFLLFIFLMSVSVFAEEKTVDKTPTEACKTLTLKSENKVITLPGVSESHTTQVYFLKNVSKRSLWVDHPVARPSASAGWSSYLQPENWSALLLNRKDFAIRCAVIEPGKVNYLDCAEVLSICVPKKVDWKSAPKGTFWLAENQPWEKFVKAVERRGLKF